MGWSRQKSNSLKDSFHWRSKFFCHETIVELQQLKYFMAFFQSVQIANNKNIKQHQQTSVWCVLLCFFFLETSRWIVTIPKKNDRDPWRSNSARCRFITQSSATCLFPPVKHVDIENFTHFCRCFFMLKIVIYTIFNMSVYQMVNFETYGWNLWFLSLNLSHIFIIWGDWKTLKVVQQNEGQ